METKEPTAQRNRFQVQVCHHGDVSLQLRQWDHINKFPTPYIAEIQLTTMCTEVTVVLVQSFQRCDIGSVFNHLCEGMKRRRVWGWGVSVKEWGWGSGVSVEEWGWGVIWGSGVGA